MLTLNRSYWKACEGRDIESWRRRSLHHTRTRCRSKFPPLPFPSDPERHGTHCLRAGSTVGLVTADDVDASRARSLFRLSAVALEHRPILRGRTRVACGLVFPWGLGGKGVPHRHPRSGDIAGIPRQGARAQPPRLCPPEARAWRLLAFGVDDQAHAPRAPRQLTSCKRCGGRADQVNSQPARTRSELPFREKLKKESRPS